MGTSLLRQTETILKAVSSQEVLTGEEVSTCYTFL